MKPIAYIASPLGFSEAGRLFLGMILMPSIDKIGFEIRDPWALTPEKLINSVQALPYGQEKRKKWREINPVIGDNNRKAIKESDIIIAVLDGPDVDSGTAAEIGYASAFKKTVFGYRGDFRLSADNEGSIVNLQVEYFIHLNGGEIVTDLESLKTVLTEYKKRFSERLA
ncbi:nucleoside 2-deoxyribosyltransferase [Candidatus Parcubacteria bacterium]|nr:nucleoside 2-deoxyribosyltransferase [Candidatus Parcubacteria bacterium]